MTKTQEVRFIPLSSNFVVSHLHRITQSSWNSPAGIASHLSVYVDLGVLSIPSGAFKPKHVAAQL